MNYKPENSLDIVGCHIFKPNLFRDERGVFFEWFQGKSFQTILSKDFDLAQANCSVSSKGVIRGIHFAKNPPGQAKYVTCFSGSVFDVVVDLRKGSPTFGKWNSVVIDSREPTALYIPSGVGHTFMALEDNTTFVYLCDQSYNPANEFDVSPFDSKIGIEWPQDISPVLSPKDQKAKTFEEMFDAFPSFTDLI